MMEDFGKSRNKSKRKSLLKMFKVRLCTFELLKLHSIKSCILFI